MFERYDHKLFKKQLFGSIALFLMGMFFGWTQNAMPEAYVLMTFPCLLYSLYKIATFNTTNYTSEEEKLLREVEKLKDSLSKKSR